MSDVDPPVSWEEQQYLDMKHERDTLRDERDRLALDLKKRIWLLHGARMNHLLYGDDGRMDCNVCFREYAGATLEQCYEWEIADACALIAKAALTPAGQRWRRERPTIWNLRGTVPEGVMRVDRKTIWGNPFVMRDEGQREAVCNLFEDYARKRHREDPQWLAPLRGKDLACWCAPKRCHAETLIELANSPITPNEATE